MAVLNQRLEHLEGKVDEINIKLDNKFVTQEEFKPVRLVVYGLVAITMLTVVGGLLALVLNPH